MLPAVTPPIVGVATSTTGLIGEAAQGPVEQAVLVTSLVEYEQVFGGPQPGQELFLGASQFFANGGRRGRGGGGRARRAAGEGPRGRPPPPPGGAGGAPAPRPPPRAH